jgi:hypothetical protein
VWEHGGEMTKVLYAHMNNKTIKKKEKEMWYLCTTELYSASRKNGILSSANKCMELENFILSEASQGHKAKSCKYSNIMKNMLH